MHRTGRSLREKPSRGVETTFQKVFEDTVAKYLPRTCPPQSWAPTTVAPERCQKGGWGTFRTLGKKMSITRAAVAAATAPSQPASQPASPAYPAHQVIKVVFGGTGTHLPILGVNPNKTVRNVGMLIYSTLAHLQGPSSNVTAGHVLL